MNAKVFLILNIFVTLEALITEQKYESMPDLFQFDDYHKCFRSNNESIYCTVTVQLSPKNPKNPSKIWSTIKNVSSDRSNYRHDILRHGICLNELCQPDEIIHQCVDRIYRTKYQKMDIIGQSTDIRCETKNSGHFIQTEDMVFISILGLYGMFVVLVTLVLEVVRRKNVGCSENKVSKIQKFFTLFSLVENVKFLLTNSFTKKADNYMLFLQGIRFVTSIGVIFTHATLVNIVIPVSNPSYIEDACKRLVTMILANGGMTVQIYFVSSSFLQAKSFFEKLKTSPVTLTYVVRCIIRRYITLTSTYVLLIALHSSWLAYLARGPFWDPIMGEDYRVCRENWWKNLLYINNFFIDDGLCMYQSWYLSVELQFTIAGLLVLWVSQKKIQIFFSIAGFIVVFQTVFMFCYLAWNHFEIALVFTPEVLYYFNLIYSKEWQATWTTTYSNLSAPIAGLIAGYFYTKYQGRQSFTRKSQKIVWWILSWFLIFFPLLFSSYYMTTHFYSHSRWFAAAYGSVCKTIFSFGVALLIFGMSQGLGGIIKRIFEWTPMHCVGQLSFGVYLVHYSILKITAAARQAPPHVTDYLMISDIVTNTSMSYLCSFVLTVFVLMPVASIVKIFL